VVIRYRQNKVDSATLKYDISGSTGGPV